MPPVFGVIFEILRANISASIPSRQAIMGAFDPVEPARTKARAKTRAVKKPTTLAERMADYIGCDTSDTWPPDAARRHKEYLRASLAQKRSG